MEDPIDVVVSTLTPLQRHKLTCQLIGHYGFFYDNNLRWCAECHEGDVQHLETEGFGMKTTSTMKYYVCVECEVEVCEDCLKSNASVYTKEAVSYMRCTKHVDDLLPLKKTKPLNFWGDNPKLVCDKKTCCRYGICDVCKVDMCEHYLEDDLITAYKCDVCSKSVCKRCCSRNVDDIRTYSTFIDTKTLKMRCYTH